MSKTVIALGGVLVLLLSAIFLFYPYFASEEASPVIEDRITTVIPVKHFYSSGTHTYVGEVQAPTPCYKVSGEAVVSNTRPDEVSLAIELRDGNAPGELCAQVISPKKFKVAFAGEEEIMLTAYLNSTKVLLSVTEVDSFEKLEK